MSKQEKIDAKIREILRKHRENKPLLTNTIGNDPFITLKNPQIQKEIKEAVKAIEEDEEKNN